MMIVEILANGLHHLHSRYVIFTDIVKSIQLTGRVGPTNIVEAILDVKKTVTPRIKKRC